MSHKSRAERAQQGDPYFRWRGGAVSRLEALTDAVFALALTLVVVSLEVPAGFDELAAAFRMLPAFAICFALLLYLWYSHHRFHRRFGLEDGLTTVLNGLMLFLVLAYVYPLKFLFFALLGDEAYGEVLHTAADVQLLMIFYSSGVVGLFGTLWLMHRLAWARREALGLTPLERALTRASLDEHAVSVGIGLLSIGIAIADPAYAPWAGMCYFLMPVLQGLNGYRHGRRVHRLLEQPPAGRPPRADP